ncbi:MAG: penicillin acylase family protein [Pirellulaceae bacterium]|nr:penicillin acylase family protein [Pirellulaceae bacterium]
MKPIPLPTTRRRFSVARDDHGVPHVEASTWLDVLYGLGYMHATDRGTQLLFSRSLANGCGAEEIADTPELLETDRFFRRVGLHLDLEREVRSLNDRVFQQITSYCEGVTDGLENSGRSLPMWATGFQPQPWNQQAVLLIGKLLSFGGLAISQMQNERLIIELVHAGANEATIRELLSPRFDNVDFDLLRQIKMSNQLSDEALEVLTDLPRLAGSNAWAVSPRRSATGAALLAADPHLEVNRLPGIWYEAVLKWDRGYLMGASLPGCPLFAVARTDRLAWGVTYMKGDTVDYFVEDCRKAESGWQYRRGSSWHDFDCREESIVRKGADPDTLCVHENPQGTLDSDPDTLGEGYHLSIAWTGNHSGHGAAAIASWLEVIGSNSTHEAMQCARHCAQPTLCWVFADRKGHIGMQSCGRFPQRGGGQIGLAPTPAWDTENHWRGFVPIEKLPSIYDPPEGFIATANEENNPRDLPPLVTQLLPGYRKRRIDQRLRELPQATLEDMQALQYDFVSLQAHDLLKVFIPHLEDGRLKERLSNWDCQYDPQSREATLFHRLYVNVLYEVLGHEQGIGWRRVVYVCTRVGYSMMIMRAADRVLQRDDSICWHGRDKGELIRRAAERAEQEPDQAWAEYNSFHFTDRFFGNHTAGRMLGFNSRRYPMPGNHATPFQGHVLKTARREQTFAPSYHFVADMGADEAWTNLPGGPSESRFSRLYKIDVARWFAGEYKRLTSD